MGYLEVLQEQYGKAVEEESLEPYLQTPVTWLNRESGVVAVPISRYEEVTGRQPDKESLKIRRAENRSTASIHLYIGALLSRFTAQMYASGEC